MKRLVVVMMVMMMVATVSANGVKEQAAYMNPGKVVGRNSRTLSGFGSITSLDYTMGMFTIDSDFYVMKDYLCTDNSLTVKYDLSDTLFVKGGIDYTYSSLTKYGTITDNHLKMYAGIGVTGTWKFLTVTGTGYIGYNCIDVINYEHKDKNVTIDENNLGYVNLRLDITVLDYITVFAGMESYQSPDSLVVWTPSTVNNYIGLNVEYPLNKTFTITGQVYHNCRHPENPILTKRTEKEESNTIISLGLKVSF